MQDAMRVGAAALGGYVLGRTKKAKAALGLALWLSGRGRPRDLVRDQAAKALQSDRGQELLAQLRGPVSTAGRQAAISFFETQAGRLGDTLNRRTEQLSDGLAETGRRGRRAVRGSAAADEDEYDEQQSEDEEDEDEDEYADEYEDELEEDEDDEEDEEEPEEEGEEPAYEDELEEEEGDELEEEEDEEGSEESEESEDSDEYADEYEDEEDEEDEEAEGESSDYEDEYEDEGGEEEESAPRRARRRVSA